MHKYVILHNSGRSFEIELERPFDETIEHMKDGESWFLYVPNGNGGTKAIGIEYLKNSIIDEIQDSGRKSNIGFVAR